MDDKIKNQLTLIKGKISEIADEEHNQNQRRYYSRIARNAVCDLQDMLEGAAEPQKGDNPWCEACKEKDCAISGDGTCEMIRIYLKAAKPSKGECMYCKEKDTVINFLKESLRKVCPNDFEKEQL